MTDDLSLSVYRAVSVYREVLADTADVELARRMAVATLETMIRPWGRVDDDDAD